MRCTSYTHYTSVVNCHFYFRFPSARSCIIQTDKWRFQKASTLFTIFQQIPICSFGNKEALLIETIHCENAHLTGFLSTLSRKSSSEYFRYLQSVIVLNFVTVIVKVWKFKPKCPSKSVDVYQYVKHLVSFYEIGRYDCETRWSYFTWRCGLI